MRHKYKLILQYAAAKWPYLEGISVYNDLLSKVFSLKCFATNYCYANKKIVNSALMILNYSNCFLLGFMLKKSNLPSKKVLPK